MAHVIDSAAPPTLEGTWADALPELSRPASPVRTPHPRLLALNDDIAAELDLDAAWLRSPEGVRFLTGESSASANGPVAQVYAGHQWGVFTPILGDGRAALLGERRDRAGRLRDLHAKGIGPTSMSRVDGFAAVGPMLREYLMGEAMHALGVPTTRALSVVATGAPRTLDGSVLPGAVLTRTATSHARIGSFEYVRAQGDPGLLRRLADHVIVRRHPRALHAQHPYRALLAEIVDALAALTVDWMRLGFVHGVLSTDNILVSAETIDYGPCAFLDAYDPGAYFSSIDALGRYAYDRQPDIMRWNLDRLGEAIAPLLDDDPDRADRVARHIVSTFEARQLSHRRSAFRDKLGLGPDVDDATVDALTEAALDLLADGRVDFTGFWRDLADAAHGDERAVRGRLVEPVAALDAWLLRWRSLAPDATVIRAVNPVYIPRNHLVEEALIAATDDDLAPFERLLELVTDPYVERSGAEYRRFTQSAPAGTDPHVTFCGT